MKRVVITGIGIVSSLGKDPNEIIGNLLDKITQFTMESELEGYPTCPIPDFDLKEIIGRNKNARYLNRGAKFALAAAHLAVKDAAISPGDYTDFGLFLASGPNLDISSTFPEIKAGMPEEDTLSALWILQFLPNTAASVIAKSLKIHGENLTIGNACAASTQAIGEAFRRIRNGEQTIALAGGGDSRLSKMGMLAYAKADALYKGQPLEKYQPFAKNRFGFIPGEGGAFLVLEELESAKARKAKIYAEICGYGSSIDGYNLTAPEPEGNIAEIAVGRAMAQASLKPDEINFIAAHGTGTKLNDQMEATLINKLFPKSPKVTAMKSYIGHLSSACGVTELSILLHCLNAGITPGINNYTNSLNHNINLLTNHTSHLPKNILLESFGFGGQNAALVLKIWDNVQS